MKQCQFIRTNNEAGSIFVPMPNSWERHKWLKGYFGKECSVAGKELWSILTNKYEVMVLIEENGIFREEKKELNEFRYLYGSVISRINKLEDDTRTAIEFSNLAEDDRGTEMILEFFKDITKLVGE